MPIILAIETSTEACSVAISTKEGVLEDFAIMPRMHSQKTLAMIKKLLSQAGINKNAIDAVAFGCGPGAFTGVRIATALTQGLAFSLDVPVIAISSLAALSQQAIRKQQATHIFAAIDARMDEIYWGTYRCDQSTNLASLVGKETVSLPKLATTQYNNSEEWVGIGTGWKYVQQIPIDPLFFEENSYPQAQDIVRLALPLFQQKKYHDASKALPVYLRNDVAKKKKER